MMKRIFTALVLVPVVLYVVLALPAYCTAVLIGTGAIIMLTEYLTLLKRNNLCPYWYIDYPVIIIIVSAAYINPETLGILMFLLPTSVLLSAILQRDDFEIAFRSSSSNLLGIAYIGGLASYLILLRRVNDDVYGAHLLIALMAIVWMTDTGAYYIGKNFGKHLLSPRISPKKTIEGAIGGIIFGIGGGLIINIILKNVMHAVECIILSMVLSFLGQLGDLAESFIKRALHAKDSSGLLPGHGGMMDRVDALVFSAPFMYLYFYVKASFAMTAG